MAGEPVIRYSIWGSASILYSLLVSVVLMIARRNGLPARGLRSSVESGFGFLGSIGKHPRQVYGPNCQSSTADGAWPQCWRDGPTVLAIRTASAARLPVDPILDLAQQLLSGAQFTRLRAE